ncbi:MAG: hypothetical protein KAH54_03720 [Candidatus Sabulitectum sp.]|nr:hypothetical protein [Candidatus Sabulitectum sp.]
MKKIIALLTIALVATLISGCGGNVPVKITNDLGAWNIEEIFIDPSEDSEWSDNLISSTLEPGDDVTLNVPAGTYGIMLTDEDEDTYTRWDVVIGSGGYEWNVDLSDIDQ